MLKTTDPRQRPIGETIRTFDPLNVELGMGSVFRNEHWRRKRAGDTGPSCHSLAIHTAIQVAGIHRADVK
jgi:hypothetical protein